MTALLKTDLINAVRFYASDDGAVTEWTTAQITYAITDAVRRFGRFLPYYQKKTIATVKDQDLYLLPSNCLMLVDVDYPLAGALPAHIWPYDFEDNAYNDLVLFREQLAARLDDQRRGGWREFNNLNYQSYETGRYVLIFPPATADNITLTCTYIAAHQGDTSNWTTIASEHEHVIGRLAASVLFERQADDLSRQADWDEGQSRIHVSSPAGNIYRRVDRVRQEVEDIYGYTVAGRI